MSIERLRIHIFFARLNDDFEQVHEKILSKQVTPNLKECCTLIWINTVQ